MAKKNYPKPTSAVLSPDVAWMVASVHNVLKIGITDQINEALTEQYKFVYAPLIRAKEAQAAKAKRGGRRGFGQEIVG